MSWGANAAEGAGSGASNAAGSAVGNGVSAAPAAGSGFSMGTPNWAGTQTPTDGTSVSMTPAQVSDTASYGTSNPSMMDKASSALDHFQQGGKNSMGKAWDGRGNNPETYGYLAAKLQGMGGGGAPQSPNMVTNINYHQPENEYLRKRRGY